MTTTGSHTMIHGVAVDAGSGLKASIRKARGVNATANDLLMFKRCVLEVLGQHASTVLLDAAIGPQVVQYYPQGCTPMLAYEADVYHISDEDKITVLPENFSIADYAKLGVKQLKFFMYYAPDDDASLNERKQQLVAMIGQECREHELVYLMEPLVYHPEVQAGTAEYAQLKPDLVRRATEVFADPYFNADVLKVEVPVDLDFVAGFGESLLSRQDALDAFRHAAEPAVNHQLVYLSAGVTFERFEASLQLATEAGVGFNGFMCGRALWSDAVNVFGAQGESALRDWLIDFGKPRLERLIAALPSQ